MGMSSNLVLKHGLGYRFGIGSDPRRKGLLSAPTLGGIKMVGGRLSAVAGEMEVIFTA